MQTRQVHSDALDGSRIAEDSHSNQRASLTKHGSGTGQWCRFRMIPRPWEYRVGPVKYSTHAFPKGVSTHARCACDLSTASATICAFHPS